ncbi:hypothetical protein KIN20_036653 [Parelaphostrongylus tenuis]|uniref:Uncharacterized protein n=1 Tax=Parelaphostrongylus tenuis TaxID=148309 RepID=A0AAD5WLG1_PARTN|nr:hypothetical protein KIN20_036653 [Parelaphostrongylus tenuis]
MKVSCTWTALRMHAFICHILHSIRETAAAMTIPFSREEGFTEPCDNPFRHAVALSSKALLRRVAATARRARRSSGRRISKQLEGLVIARSWPCPHLLMQERRFSYPQISSPPPLTAFKTAREKHRSVSAEEAAVVPDELSTAGGTTESARDYRSPPMKSQQPRFYGGPLKGALSHPLHTPGSRSKTLAWFLADDLLEKKNGAAVNGSMRTESKNCKSDEKKRRRALRRAKKSETAAGHFDLAEIDTSAATLEDLFASERQRILSGVDDFWYYDVASDGYYYEQNGAKGWRRRMPNSAIQRMKEQDIAQLTNGGKIPMLNMQTAVHAHALLQSAMFSQPALKYYDANSDGFYYEMASVDGWKRRQPSKPTTNQSSLSGASSVGTVNNTTGGTDLAGTPTHTTTSYGATLARGQVPRNHSVLDDSSASSSVSEDNSMQDVFGLDTAFSGLTMGCDSPFRPLNPTTNTNTNGNYKNNSSTTVSRPESLLISDQILPGFNADKFIEDLSFSGLDPAKVLNSVSRSPADPWASRCGGWALPPFDKPPTLSSSLVEDDDNSSMLLKDLEKIWATPVGGLNA